MFRSCQIIIRELCSSLMLCYSIHNSIRICKRGVVAAYCTCNCTIKYIVKTAMWVNIVKVIKQYQKKWLQHVQRMDTYRLPKQALQYTLKGRRDIGRPRKRWRDQLHLEDQGTGNTPNPSGTWRCAFVGVLNKLKGTLMVSPVNYLFLTLFSCVFWNHLVNKISCRPWGAGTHPQFFFGEGAERGLTLTLYIINIWV